MSELSWAETVRRVHQRADNRCEYYQTAQRVMGQAMHVEHINPDGPDDLENEEHLFRRTGERLGFCPPDAVV